MLLEKLRKCLSIKIQKSRRCFGRLALTFRQLETYRNIESYTDTEEAKLHPKGPFELPDKSVYEGQWSDKNMRHGRGK